MNRSSFVISLLAMLAIATTSAADTFSLDTDKYKIQLINPPNAIRSFATGVNDSGAVVGYYFTPTESNPHGYLYSSGKYQTIDAPGKDVVTYPNFINNSGTIVGDYYDSLHHHHGFVVFNGKFETCDVPRAVPGIYAFSAMDDHGDIAGSLQDSQDLARGFIVRLKDLTRVDMPPELKACKICCLNNKGDMVGLYLPLNSPAQLQSSFIAHRGIVSMYQVPAAGGTYLTGINDDGLIVGFMLERAGPRWAPDSFVLQNGKMSLVAPPPGCNLRLLKVNNKGQLVGSIRIMGPRGPGRISVLLSPK